MSDVLEDVGTITATWTDPTGVVWPLSDTSDDVGWFTSSGPAGWDATTYEIVTDPEPRGGETVRFIRSKPGHLVWPLYTFGYTHLQYVQRHRAIKRAFTMTVHRSTPGTLRVARPDGTAREIDAYYESGFEGEAGDGSLTAKDAISLFCPDGYWRDVAAVTSSLGYIPGIDYLGLYPQVSDGRTLGESVITNPGDAVAWPETTVTGPMTALTAANVTTGDEYVLTYTLLPGEQLTVTTQRPSVRGPAGQNLAASLNWPTAYLWPLLPGDNDVVLAVADAAAGTTVDLTFHPRYEGA